MGYDTAQSGVIPRQMPNANYTGAPDEVMISYCNGVKCLVIHDGVTPGGCWRVCAGGGGGCGGGCAPDCSKCDQHVLNLINNWFNENHMGGLKDWNVTKGPAGQHADDNILHLIFGDGSQWDIDLFDDDGVVGISWDEDDRELTVTMDDGSTKILTIGDKYARLNAAGDVIIFPDGRTWRHCCAEEFRGTCGCDYPANPSVGDVHLNGGNSGCIKRFDGENWVNIARIRPGDKFFCTDTRREFTANGTCNWVETSDTICDRPLLGDEFNDDDVYIPVEPCIVPPCDCEGDPNCECFCEDALEPKHRVSISSFIERIADRIVEEACFDNVPDLGETCGDVINLVLVNQDGCMKLATVNQAELQEARGAYHEVDPSKPKNESGYTLPADFPVPNLYYSLADYKADGGNDPNDRSGIDEAKIMNSRISRVAFDNMCRRRYEITIYTALAREATAEEAYRKQMALSYRWRVNGGAWNYATRSGTGEVTNFAYHAAIEGRYVQDQFITFPEGLIEYEAFYLAPDYDEANPMHASIEANTYEFGFAAPVPRIIIRPALS